MLDTPQFFLKLFIISAYIAYIIYSYQLFFAVFRKDSTSFKTKNILTKSELFKDKAANSKIDCRNNASPNFHKLRQVIVEDVVKYYFVNKGGDIFNMKVRSLGDLNVYISPRDKIKTNESGCFKFKLDNKYFNKELNFEISYSNQDNQYKEDKFCYSFKNKMIFIIKK